LFDLSKEQLFTSEKLRFVQKKLRVRKKAGNNTVHTLCNSYQ
jgi:hypothetical protein